MEYKSQEYNPHSFKVKESETDFLLEQDVQAYKDFATESRQIAEQYGQGKQYRSFAIIPDIVAIDILTKYQIDIHSNEFMSNPALIRRVKEIIKTDYPALLTGSITNSKTYY